MKNSRRNLCMLTALLLMFCAVIPASAAAGRMLGDVDHDNDVTILDATAIQRDLAGFITLDDLSKAAADADCDGEFTILDATAIQRYLAGFMPKTPIGEPTDPYLSAKNAAVDALSARLAATVENAGGRPVMIRSYDTENQVLRIAAYTYDNALAAMAFLSEGRTSEAEEILDAFVYVVAHDRYKPGRIRSAYASDTVYWNRDGEDSVKLPGWYTYEWLEDERQVGMNLGDTAYAVLALLQYDAVNHTDKYLATAKTLMDWVLAECTDETVGFTAGYQGWPENGSAKRLTNKSTENNLDAYAAFRQLYAVTGEESYRDAAESALAFVKSMYHAEGGYFYTGSKDDGITPDNGIVALDAQVWSALALGGDFTPYDAAMTLAGSMKTAEGGYPFCQENRNGGFWCEGTAFTALTFRERGDDAAYAAAMDTLCGVQLSSGLFPAATVDHLYTGIWLDAKTPWEYCRDPHIAPAAWFVMAANGFNPYTFD